MKPNSSNVHSTKAPATTSVQRNVVVRAKSGRRTENEPNAAHIMDHRRLRRLVDLAPQSSHVHVDKVGLRYEFIIPDFFQQHRSRQRLILAPHHVFKQAELTRQEIDRAIPAPGGALDQIKLERSDAEHR